MHRSNSAGNESLRAERFARWLGTRERVKVSLPDDMAAGDTISGTVIAEPSGKTDKDKERNAGELNGYVIELETQKSPVSNGVMRRIALAPTMLAPSLILLDSKGKQIAVFPIVLLPSAPTAPSTVNLPPLGQTGRPLQVQGPFDGDSSNTSAKIGGTDAKVIAESPRKLVVETPGNVVGPSEIKVTENGTTARGAFRNLKIDLTAPKTSLMKGESTELHVQVNGLEGITQPVQVQVRNESPSNINLNGGNTQNIVIQPSQVKMDGSFNWTTNVTGIGNGGFQITGKLPDNLRRLLLPQQPANPRRHQRPRQFQVCRHPLFRPSLPHRDLHPEDRNKRARKSFRPRPQPVRLRLQLHQTRY